MRKIQYRGKRVDGKGWVFGYYWMDCISCQHKITVSNMGDDNFRCHEVIPETVGQFWKKGLREFYGDDLFYAEASPSGSKKKRKMLCMVQDSGDGMDIVVWHQCEWWAYCFLNMTNIEMAGNIHDNPELLK